MRLSKQSSKLLQKPEIETLEVTGLNPISSLERAHLLHQDFLKDEVGRKIEAHEAEVVEKSIGLYSDLCRNWQEINDQSKSLLIEVKELSSALSKASAFSSASKTNLQALRWENRVLSQLEVQLTRDAVVQELTRALPGSMKSCPVCLTSRLDVTVCRIASGHCKDLSGPRKDLVEICHSRFMRKLEEANTETNPDSELADLILPFQTEIQELIRNDDAHVSSAICLPCLEKIPISERTSRHVGEIHTDSSSSAIPFALKMHRAFNYSGQHIHHNILLLDSREIVYTAGTVCVVLNLESKNQRLFTGHSDKVLAIAKHPHETTSVIVSGQGGKSPVIILWNVINMETLIKIDDLHLQISPPKAPIGSPGVLNDSDCCDRDCETAIDYDGLLFAVRALDFSPDGSYMLAVFDDKNNSLALYGDASEPGAGRWSQHQLLCLKSSGQRRILAVKFNTASGDFATCGVRHMVFWKIDDACCFSGRNGVFGCETYEATFSCIEFMDADKTLSGSVCGALWLWSGLSLVKIIYDAHTGPLLDIKVDGLSIITSGQDQKLCFWCFASSFESIPAGELAKGDFLMREIRAADILVRHGQPWAKHLIAGEGLGAIRSIAWCQHQIYCGTTNNHIFVLDELKEIGSFMVTGHHSGRVRGLCRAGILPWLVTAGDDSTVMIRDLETLQTLAARNLNLDQPASKFLLEQLRNLQTERNHKIERVDALLASLSPQMSKTDRSNLEHEMQQLKYLIHNLNMKIGPLEEQLKYLGSSIRISCLDLSHDGKIIAVGFNDGGFAELELRFDRDRTLQIENLHSRIVKSIQKATTCLRFSPDDRLIAVGNADGYVRVFVSERIEEETVPLYTFKCINSVSCIDWDALCHYIRCNDHDLRIYIFELGKFQTQSRLNWASGTCKMTWSTHPIYLNTFLPEDVKSLIVIPTCEVFVLGDVTGDLNMYRFPCISVDAPRTRFPGHCGPVDFMVHGNKDLSLISAGADLNVFLWSLVTNPSGISSKTEEQKDLHKLAQSNLLPRIKKDTDVDMTLNVKFFCSSEVVDNLSEQGSFDVRNQPWMEICQPPRLKEQVQSNQLTGPSYGLTLEHVFGYSGKFGRHNIILLPGGELLYTVMALCVLQSLQNGSQRFFRGHQGTVLSIALHPNGVTVASGDSQGLSKSPPDICIWSSESSKWAENQLSFPSVRIGCPHSRQVSALSFSADGRLLIAIGISSVNSEHILTVYRCDTDAMAASLMILHSLPCKKVFSLCLNPYNDEIITGGVEHFNFWRIQGSNIQQLVGTTGQEFYDFAVKDKNLCSTLSEAFHLASQVASQTVLCIECLDTENVIAGTMDGLVIMWRRHSLVTIIQAHKGPVFDIHHPSNRKTLEIQIQFKRFGEGCTRWWDRSGQRIGQFSDEIKKGMIIQEAATIHVLAGTSADETDRRASSAVQHFLIKHEKERGMKQDSYFDVSYSKTLCDPPGFVTSGKDGKLIVWKMQKELYVGLTALNLQSVFDSHSNLKVHGPGITKSSKCRSISTQSFVSCLYSCNLAQDPAKTNSTCHPRISQAEATRIFQDVLDQRMGPKRIQELFYEEFIDALERVSGLINLKRYAYPFEFVEAAERRLNDLETEWSHIEESMLSDKVSLGLYEQTIKHMRADIQNLSKLIAETRVDVRSVIIPMKEKEVDINKSGIEKLQLPCCVKAVFFRDENTVFAGTSLGEILEINLSSKSVSNVVASCPSAEMLCACTVQANANVIAGYSDGGIYLIDGTSKEFSRLHLASAVVTALDSTKFHLPETNVFGTKESKSTVILAAAYSKGCLELRDLNKSFNLIKSAKYDGGEITRIKISPVSTTGFSIAIGFDTGLIKIITSSKRDLLDWQVVSHCSELHGEISHIDWSLDASTFLAGCILSAEAVIWSVAESRTVRVSDISKLELASHTCPFGWQMLGIHQFLSLQEKLIGRHIKPAIGLRVKRSARNIEYLRNETSRLTSSVYETQKGTIVSLTNDNKCVVEWDKHSQAEKNEKSLLSRHRIGAADVDGSVCYDLALVCANHTIENELAASDWCETHIDEKLVAFGDLNGTIYLINYPCSFIEQNPLFKASIAHPRDQMLLKFSHDGKCLFSFSKYCSQVLQWKCSLESSRTQETFRDFLVSCMDKRAEVCLLDFLVALHEYGDQLYECNTVESLLSWKRYSSIVLNLYENCLAKTVANKNMRNSYLGADLEIAQMPDKHKTDVFQRLYQQQRIAPAKDGSQIAEQEEERANPTLRPLFEGRFYREKSKPEKKPQSVVQILRRGVHAARKEYLKTRKSEGDMILSNFEITSSNMDTAKSKKAESDKISRGIVTRKVMEADQKANHFDDLNQSNVLVPEFEILSPFIFKPLRVLGHNESRHQIASTPTHKPEKFTFEIVSDIYEKFLEIGKSRFLTENLLKDILYKYPELAVRLGLRSRIRENPLYTFDYSLNKNVASPDLMDAILICTSNMSHRQRTDENLVQTSKNKIVLYDFLVQFCHDAVWKAYQHLHASDRFNPMIEDAGSDLNTLLMPIRDLEDIRLELTTENFINSCIDIGITPFSNLLTFPYGNFDISPAVEFTEDSAIAYLKSMGLEPETHGNITMSELFNIIQSNPLAGQIGSKKISFDALVMLLTFSGLLSARRVPISQDENRFELVLWSQPIERHKTAKKLLSFRTAKYVFDTLDSKSTGFITHSDFVKGLRLHKNIADLLGLPQAIRQEDGSREKYQEMFMHMDPFSTRKISRSNFLGYFCGPEEKRQDPLFYEAPERVPLSLPDPDSIFILTLDEAERAFQFLDFPCTGTLTKLKFQIGLGSYPALARRLGMPSTFAEKDCSNQFFNIVFGHISQGEDVITFVAFSKYFSTRLEDRTLHFFRAGSIKLLDCLGWLTKAPPKQTWPRYMRQAAVQTDIDVKFYVPGVVSKVVQRSPVKQMPGSLAPVQSIMNDTKKKQFRTQKKQLDEDLPAEGSLPPSGTHRKQLYEDLPAAASSKILQSRGAEDRKLCEILDQSIELATTAALEIVVLSQTPMRVMDPDSEALAGAAMSKIALSCIYPGQLVLQDLESAGDNFCSKINEVRRT